MPPVEPAAGAPRRGTASPLPESARRCAQQRGEWMPTVLRPAQDSSEQGSCKTDSRGRDDEPLLYVRHIAGSRHGRQLSRDAHAATTAPPLANNWPTVKKAQYVAIIGSSFRLQRYNFSANATILRAIVRGPSALFYFHCLSLPQSCGNFCFCQGQYLQGVGVLNGVRNEILFREGATRCFGNGY